MAEKEIFLTNIKMYDQIVSSAYAQYQELISAYDKLLDSKSCTNANLDSEEYTLQSAMDSAAAVVVVFAEMTLESFCNVYLLKHCSKNSFKGMEFIKKVKYSIIAMLGECGISVTEEDAKEYYGNDIPRIVNIRNRLVHRYPVQFDLDLESDEQFEKDAISAAVKIKEQFLRRIERTDVENAATAYHKFKDKLSSAGVDFSKMGFIC